ncbi:hypothetical protein [Candidatus Vidania fulgoroideorum]
MNKENIKKCIIILINQGILDHMEAHMFLK